MMTGPSNTYIDTQTCIPRVTHTAGENLSWIQLKSLGLSVTQDSLLETSLGCYHVLKGSAWNQCVKWVAPCSIAQSFIALATISAIPGSISLPVSMVLRRDL